MKKLLRILPSGVKQGARTLARKLSGSQLVPVVRADRGALSTLDASRPLRCGLIGLGAMGRTHVDVLRGRPHYKLAAITSRNPQKQTMASELGCRWFDSPEQMITSGEVDVVVLVTPPWQHVELAVAALRANVHVVCEKPLAVTVSQADAVLHAAKQSKALLTVVFQSRYEPAYQYARSLLAGGELGPILRAEMIETAFRPEAYYRSSTWRGTWKGEGGGVLVNQAPHVFDRYAWLCGMPAEVTGFCATALHQIEVEDAVSAVFQHAGGAQGHVHVSTNECPAVSRVVIACDRGRITIDDGTVRVDRLKHSLRQGVVAGTDFFGDIPSQAQQLGAASSAWSKELLVEFYDRFALAIAGQQPVPVSAAEAAEAVELANAILLSAASRRAVHLPLNRRDVDTFLASKVNPART